MRFTVFDVEANGLLGKADRIYCLCYCRMEDGQALGRDAITSPKEMRAFLRDSENGMLVGHNIIRYDLPLLENLIGASIPEEIPVADTLPISQALYALKGFRHGLKDWGERLDVIKPEIRSWSLQGLEDYIHRCQQDVEINTKLFQVLWRILSRLYQGNDRSIMGFIRYLNFKMECLREQEQVGITLDLEACERGRLELEYLIEEKCQRIAIKMPRVLLRARPEKVYKKDGSLSEVGRRWFALLERYGLPKDSEGIYEMGNPTSVEQLKSWLLSLGWQPNIHKTSKQTGEKIPQVMDGDRLSQSVRNLIPDHPEIGELDNLYMLRHRLGLFKSFLDVAFNGKDYDRKVYATAHGLTSTLRLQHSKPCVNLPSVDRPYGEQIRGLLVTPDDRHILCGCDVSALEDSTKQHYIHFFDPDYVREMRVEGYDPHVEIASLSGLMTREEAELFLRIKNGGQASPEEMGEYKRLKTIRHKAKQVNFSSVYGVGVAKLQETLGGTMKEAQQLHDTYWKRNWAVREIMQSMIVTEINLPYVRGLQRFFYNPVSGFWLLLRADKDRFSALNQSTGVFVFDTWLMCYRRLLRDIPDAHVVLQYHDEHLTVCRREDRDRVDAAVRKAMDMANEKLRLNVPIGISVSWGRTYAECH